MSVLAIIPARGGSKGIPRKNLVELCGQPLIVHTIRQALAAETVGTVLVNSEDAEIRAIAEATGVRAMSRPDEFTRDDSIQEVDRLLRWTVHELEGQGERHDVIVLLYATSPLRPVAAIDRAVRMITEDGYDSVLSVYEDARYLWRKTDDTVAPINYDPKTRGPRQKESWNQWAENKAVYAFRRDLLVETGCRLGGRIGCVEMPGWRSVDVDGPDDLELVRYLMTSRLPRVDDPS